MSHASDRSTAAEKQPCRQPWRAFSLALMLAFAAAIAVVAQAGRAPATRPGETQWHALPRVGAAQHGLGQMIAMSLKGHSLVAWRESSSDGLRIDGGSEFAGAEGPGAFLSELTPLGWREHDGQLQLLGMNDAHEIVLEEIDLRIVLPDDPIVVESTATVLQRIVLPDDPIVIERGVLSPPGVPVDIRREAAGERLGLLSLAPELDLGLVTSWSDAGEFLGATLVSPDGGRPNATIRAGQPSARGHVPGPIPTDILRGTGGHVPGPIPIDILRGSGGSAVAGTLRDSWLEDRQLRALVERESAEATTELVLLSTFLPDDLDEPLAVAERVLFERDGLALMPGTLVRLRLEAARGDTVGTLVGWSPSDDSAGGDEPSGLSWTYVRDVPIPIPAGTAALPAPPFPIDTERRGRVHAGRHVSQVPEPIDFLPSPPFPIETERAGRHVPQVPEPIDFGAGDASVGTLHVTLPSPAEPIELLVGLRVAEVVVSGPEGRVYEAQFDHSPDGRLSAAWWSDGQVVHFHGLDASSLPAVLLEGVDAEPIAVHVPALPADLPLAMLLPGSRDRAPNPAGSTVPEVPEDILRVPSVPSPVFGALRVHLPSAIELLFEPIDRPDER